MIYSGFQGIDPNKIKLAQTFGASKWQILTKVVLPGSVPTLIAALKVKLGLDPAASFVVPDEVYAYFRAKDADRAAVRVDRTAADQAGFKLPTVTKLASHCVQRLLSFGNDLRANSITR